MSEQPDAPDLSVKVQPQEKHRVRRVPPYHVILENDDHHSMEFVVNVLRKVLGYAQEKCLELMLQAHTAGEAVVWTGPKEVAELKVEQITTFHEMRETDQAKLGPLGCRIEPAPG